MNRISETSLGTAGALAIVLSLSLVGCAADDGAWFQESAGSSGIEFRHSSGHDGTFLFPEIIGGGAALFDMDGDGDLDAYLVQSGSLHEPGSGRNQLFANRGDGNFEEVTDGSGADDPGYGMGVAVGDYDNDGDNDLYVTNYGPDVLLRNEGDGKFVDATAESGIDNPSWGTSVAFLDYNHDGWLDIYVTNYVNWTPATEQDCYSPAGTLDYCLPTNYNAPAADRLFHNQGGGRFSDVSEDRGLLATFGNGLGVVAADYSGDGQIDIFVANDTMMNQLWINQGPRGFDDQALLRGTALDEHGMAKAGMGTDAADIDDDGDMDLLVVNLQGQTDSFFRNNDGLFTDESGDVGLTGSARRFTRFGIGFADFDNDGRLDLYQANGRVIRSSEPNVDDPYAEPNMLLRGQGDGRFAEVVPAGGTSTPLTHTSRAVAFGDVDGDGGIDLLVVNRDGPAYLLRNRVADRGNWVRFQALDEHGRDALGAVIRLSVGERRLTRSVRAAQGYCSSSDARAHFGIGPVLAVTDVEVFWPDGTIEKFGDFDASGDHLLTKSAGSS